jgi:hypothetical protein
VKVADVYHGDETLDLQNKLNKYVFSDEEASVEEEFDFVSNRRSKNSIENFNKVIGTDAHKNSSKNWDATISDLDLLSKKVGDMYSIVNGYENVTEFKFNEESKSGLTTLIRNLKQFHDKYLNAPNKKDEVNINTILKDKSQISNS